MAENEEKLKSLLMRVKDESEKAGLKLNTRKNLRSWHPVPLQIEGGKGGSSDRLFSWAPKSRQMVTAALKLKDACSWEGKL